MSQPPIDEPTDNLAALESANSALKRQLGELAVAGANDRTVARIGAGATKTAAWIAALSILGNTLVGALVNHSTPVVNCGTEREAVVRVMKQVNAWNALPSDAEVQKQCKLNEFVAVNYPKAKG